MLYSDQLNHPSYTMAARHMIEESTMASSVEHIEREIKNLSPDQLNEFRLWFEQFDSEKWDAKIQQDAENGRLDALAGKAVKEHQAGKTKPL